VITLKKGRVFEGCRNRNQPCRLEIIHQETIVKKGKKQAGTRMKSFFFPRGGAQKSEGTSDWLNTEEMGEKVGHPSFNCVPRWAEKPEKPSG